jgi:hypothetical protein
VMGKFAMRKGTVFASVLALVLVVLLNTVLIAQYWPKA